MDESSFANSRKAGTAGGTLLSLFCNIHFGDILKTMLTAAIGAIVSFTVSCLLRELVNRLKR